MKTLPSWTSLLENFPNYPAAKVFNDIGGKVKLNHDIGVFKNACATRLSKALNASGEAHHIPFYKTQDRKGNDQVQVSSGENKHWYIFRVKAIKQYLEEYYGQPQTLSPEEYRDAIDDKSGIIIFEVTGWSDATGHADLWHLNTCIGSDYGDKASRVFFWEAPHDK